MNYKLKTLKLSAIFVALLSSIQLTKAAPPMSNHPSRTEGTAFGFGVGVKMLNLKNIATKNPIANPLRSHDGMANTSSPVLSIFARKYIPDFLPLPMFGGLEFNYLTQMRKTSIYANLNQIAGTALDTGYRYEERWDARAMLGVQILECSQLDFWAQAGLQLTYFDYQGITNTNGGTLRFNMNNNYAVAPTGGLEMRFSQPNISCLFGDGSVVTDFILGWTAGYRNAFKVLGSDTTGNTTYDIAMSSNWSHTFGLKVMFRF